MYVPDQSLRMAISYLPSTPVRAQPTPMGCHTPRMRTRRNARTQTSASGADVASSVTIPEMPPHRSSAASAWRTSPTATLIQGACDCSPWLPFQMGAKSSGGTQSLNRTLTLRGRTHRSFTMYRPLASVRVHAILDLRPAR